MEWYEFIAVFFCGAFFANTVPHLVQGTSGNKFPTPFANPPGKGLSSPTVNVLWALFNLLVGYVLLRASHLIAENYLGTAVLFVGFALFSIFPSKHFQHRDKE